MLHKRNRDISASPTRVIIHQQSAQCARRLRGTHKGSRGPLPRDRLCATAPAAPVVALLERERAPCELVAPS